MKKTVIASTSNKQALRRVRAKAGVKAPYHVLCDASFLRCAFDYFCQVEKFQLQQKQKKKIKDEAAGIAPGTGGRGGGAKSRIGFGTGTGGGGRGGGAGRGFGRGGHGSYHGSQWGGHAAEPTPEDNMYPPLRDLVNNALGGGPTFLHILEESKQAFIQTTLEPTGKAAEKDKAKKPAKEGKNGPIKEKPKYVLVQKFLGQMFENVPSLPPKGFQQEAHKQQSATAEGGAADTTDTTNTKKKNAADSSAAAVTPTDVLARNEHKAIADRVIGSLLLSKGGADALSLTKEKANAAVVEGMYIVGTNSHDTRRELQSRCGSLFAVPTLRFTFNPTLLWLEEGEEKKAANVRGGGTVLQTHGTFLDRLRQCFEGAAASPSTMGLGVSNASGTRSLIATPIATSVSAAKLKHVTSIADRAFLRSLESGEYFEKASAGKKRPRADEDGDDDTATAAAPLDGEKDTTASTSNGTPAPTRAPKPVKNIYNQKLMKHLQSKGVRVRASAFTRAEGGGLVTPPTANDRKAAAPKTNTGGKKTVASTSSSTSATATKNRKSSGPKEHGANPLSVKKKKQRETFDFTKAAS